MFILYKYFKCVCVADEQQQALEPYISQEIMTLHHTKHHQTYVNGLNAAEEAYSATDSTKKQISLQSALKFNGGGHINHSLFWKNLAPSKEQGGKIVSGGALEKALVRDFGSVEEFKKEMNTKTAAVQGSGWGWLVGFFLRFVLYPRNSCPGTGI